MPDEERVRTKRRKLDSIITKLHQVTTLGSESHGEEENPNKAVKENGVVSKGDEPLPKPSRRKLHRAVKQKQTSRTSEDELHAEEEPQGAERGSEIQPAENGMEVDGEQEVPCNGEGNTSREMHSDSVPVVKQEPVENYENSLEGLQKMLGYSIREEVGKEEGTEKTKKRLLSESSDPDSHVMELPRRVECTACGRNVNPAHGTICRHPLINVLVCKKCNQYYNSGPFTRDEFGIDEQCRWCGDGGSLLCCDKCDKAFCKSCIKRNFGRATLKDIVNAPEGVEWLCFCCNPKPLSKLVKACNRIMNILQMQKSQKTIFKTKKGPALTDTPNQKERRNRLSSFTENLGSDGALSPCGSPSKKNLSYVSEDDSDEEDSITEQRNKKAKTRATKNSKQNGLAKRDALVIDDDSDSDNVVETVKVSKGKSSKAQAELRAKRKLEVTVESDDGKNQKGSKKSKTKKTRTKKDLSSESVSDSGKQKSKSKPKPKGKTRSKHAAEAQSSEKGSEEEEDSENDSLSDFISMMKEKRQWKKDVRRGKKGAAKKKTVSDSEDEEEESEEDKKSKRKRKTSVTQKQTRKRPRKVTSSEDESKSSGDQSDSEGPVTRNKKKQPQKQRKKKKKVASESDRDDDDDDEDEEIGRKKKGKSRRKAKKGSSESDDDKRKGKKKGKGKQKGRKKHYIEKDSDESEDEDEEEVEEEEEVSPSKRKGRKKIRKLIEDEKLAEETKRARKLEEERRKRLLERTRINYEDDMPGESAKVSRLVLESDPSTKEPIVEVKEDLLQYLKPHQCKGIQFMYDCVIESVKSWKKEEPGGGCLLAHCMGLGKTLQVVALVHTLMTHKDINMQRVLVVAPLNTVLNWRVEFDKWLSVDDRLEVLILQEVGGNNWNRADMLKHWLRYGGVLIMGYSMYRNLSQCYRVRSKIQKKIFQQALVDPGPELVICDEGHILRNDGSAISKALNGIKTKRRIVLTGTPLQNNLIEYHCMVSFVKPSLLGTRKEFTNTFVNPIENGQCADSTALDVQLMKQRCHVLHKMLEGCVQRRDYAVLIPFLPRKHEYVIKVRISASQRKLYQYFLSTFVFPEGDLGKKGVSLFSDYQALMRIWTHPWCLKLEALRRPEKFVETDSMDDFVVDNDEEEEEESESEKTTTSEEEEDPSSSDSEDERQRRRNKQGGGRSKKDTSSDEDDSDNDSEDESEDEVLPLSSRGKGAANKTNKASSSTVNIDGEDITVVDINDGASTSRGKRGEEQALSSKNDIREREGKTATKNNGRQSRNSSKNSSDTDIETNSAFGSTRSGTTFKDMEVEKEWYDEFLTDTDESNVQLSGKLVLLMEILADAEAVGDKVLVFSQSLVTLDLIEKVLLGGGAIGGDRENWCRGCDYFRMDGSTSATMRQRWADIFNDDDNKTARLFLISTKAGGLGINLVAANRVVVFDVSWNPSHDVQSIFRVYRFGQTKPVYVYRLIAQGTMEEKIYDRQVTKLAISGRVVDEQQIERHFTAADLRELYNFNPDVLEEDKETEGGKEDEAENETQTTKENEGGQETVSVRETGAVKEADPEKENGAAKETEASKEKPERPTLPLPKDAVLADLINRLHPKWIVNYHEHDSLLENIESEKMTEEEMKAAWEAYEAEKSGRLAPAHARGPDPLQGGHAQTQQQVAERIRLNSEMLQQIQQIRQLQEMQQRQEIEERMRRVRQQREQMFQQHREALLQQRQRQEDELRRQNQLRFIQHMTQPTGARQPLQVGQNTINVQTRFPTAATAPRAPPPPYQPITLRYSLPSTVRLSIPSTVAAPSPVTPPTINLTLGPSIRPLSPTNPQLPPLQNPTPK